MCSAAQCIYGSGFSCCNNVQLSVLQSPERVALEPLQSNLANYLAIIRWGFMKCWSAKYMGAIVALCSILLRNYSCNYKRILHAFLPWHTFKVNSFPIILTWVGKCLQFEGWRIQWRDCSGICSHPNWPESVWIIHGIVTVSHVNFFL